MRTYVHTGSHIDAFMGEHACRKQSRILGRTKKTTSWVNEVFALRAYFVIHLIRVVVGVQPSAKVY